MYAYRQEVQRTELYAVPQRKTRVHTKPSPNIKTVKRKNPALEFVRLTVTLAFLFAFGIFIFPTGYNSLVKQVFYPSILKTSTGYESAMIDRNPVYDANVNLYSQAFPTAKYINNGIFGNKLLLFTTIQKITGIIFKIPILMVIN